MKIKMNSKKFSGYIQEKSSLPCKPIGNIPPKCMILLGDKSSYIMLGKNDKHWIEVDLALYWHEYEKVKEYIDERYDEEAPETQYISIKNDKMLEDAIPKKYYKILPDIDEVHLHGDAIDLHMSRECDVLDDCLKIAGDVVKIAGLSKKNW